MTEILNPLFMDNYYYYSHHFFSQTRSKCPLMPVNQEILQTEANVGNSGVFAALGFDATYFTGSLIKLRYFHIVIIVSHRL